MADMVFVLYMIMFIIVCLIAATPQGKTFQQDFMAFRETRKFYANKGITWPPR